MPPVPFHYRLSLYAKDAATLALVVFFLGGVVGGWLFLMRLCGFL